MRRFVFMAAGFALAVVLAGCGSSGSDPVAVEPPAPAPPPPPPPIDFTTFVKDRFAETSDTTDPVNVDDEDFAFADNDNPDAFDDLL